jgi:hypothetical protein
MPRKENIGMYPKGMDTRSDETSLINGTAREIRNYDVDRDGNLERRRPIRQLLAGSDYHSLHSAKHGALYGCIKNELGRFDILNKTFTPLATMPDAFRTDFVDFRNETLVFNPSFAVRILPQRNEIRTVGVPVIDTGIGMFTVTSTGGLREGDYSVALSIVDDLGEESALSPEYKLSVPEGGGITVIGLPLRPLDTLRIYCTTRNGEELYEVYEGEMTVVSVSIDQAMVNNPGRQAETMDMEPLPPGQFVTAQNSRVFVAANDRLYYSEPFRPHLTKTFHNFIKFNGIIRMLKATDEGLYVGDDDGVHFLTGRNPEDFQTEIVSSYSPVYGTAVSVSSDEFGDRTEESVSVVWLTTIGYLAGSESGTVFELHPGQLDLPAYTRGFSCFHSHNGRKQIITPVASSSWLGTGTALDSNIH